MLASTPGEPIPICAIVGTIPTSAHGGGFVGDVDGDI
jgi:hypothetical protein